MTPSHQILNAQRQQAEVKGRVEDALAEMSSELQASIDRQELKPPWRISRSEVLRRAGNVDKNTLKQPYHKELDARIDAFLLRATDLFKGNSFEKSVSRRRPPTEPRLDLDHYAQMLAAANIVRERAVSDMKAMKARMELVEEENRRLRIEVATMRGDGQNVVPISQKLKS